MSDIITGAKRYQRGNPQRERVIQAERFKAVEFGNPFATFRAAISSNWNDLTTDRRAYHSLDVVTNGDMDTVFWDYWDDDYNRNVFEPFIQPSGIDAGRIGAVELKVPGLYAIQALIDWIPNEDTDPPLAGGIHTWIGSNYDAAGLQYTFMNLDSQILGAWTLNQFRVLWPAYLGSENWVEIIAGFDCAAHTPLYIPGDISGYWSFPPMLTIAYFGGLEGPENFGIDL
jgi:hypothetical protein